MRKSSKPEILAKLPTVREAMADALSELMAIILLLGVGVGFVAWLLGLI